MLSVGVAAKTSRPANCLPNLNLHVQRIFEEGFEHVAWNFVIKLSLLLFRLTSKQLETFALVAVSLLSNGIFKAWYLHMTDRARGSSSVTTLPAPTKTTPQDHMLNRKDLESLPHYASVGKGQKPSHLASSWVPSTLPCLHPLSYVSQAVTAQELRTLADGTLSLTLLHPNDCRDKITLLPLQETGHFLMSRFYKSNRFHKPRICRNLRSLTSLHLLPNLP